MSDWRVQYWDSTLFVSYLTGREPERVQTIDGLLQQYEKGAIQIVISSFVIAEVRRIPRRNVPGPPLGEEEEVEVEPMDSGRLDQIRELFKSDQLDYRVLTPRIAEIAADIGNQYPKLLPPDCVHIATAIHAGADVLFTYDGVGQRRRPADMLRYDARIGDPALRIIQPFVPSGPLFDAPR